MESSPPLSDRELNNESGGEEYSFIGSDVPIVSSIKSMLSGFEPQLKMNEETDPFGNEWKDASLTSFYS